MVSWSYIASPLCVAAEDEGGVVTAEAQGVDSCWINFFDPEHARTLLGLPENEEVLMLLDLGYAESSPERIIKNRKELALIVSYM